MVRCDYRNWQETLNLHPEKRIMTIDPVLKHIESEFDKATARYLDFLRIPSISTDPAYREDVRRAAAWLGEQLKELGFDVTLHDTPGHPILVGHHNGPAGRAAPHLLYYGHYDVQPPDPLELWTTPPFEPAIVEGPHGPRVVARGAVDDKGQVMTFIEAFRAWKAVHGALPAEITVLVEGEEECGGPSLPGFLAGHRDELGGAAIAIVTDTNSWNIDTPAITYRLRGLVYVEITIEGPSRDLHSGLFGGAVVNPINVLTEILGQLHDGRGRVQVPGFYDDVCELAPAKREAWAALPFDEKAFLGEIGLTSSIGEEGWSILERIWARPTCDINGIWGGYTGAGAKTVIASRASAKLSFRLVPDQDPQKILDGLRSFIETRMPADCRLRMEQFGVAPGIRVPIDGPFMRAAQQGLSRIYNKPPAMIGCGGSIPVVALLKDQLGLDTILAGFGLDDDRIHSPNEKFELKCFKNGILSHAAMLAKLGDVQ